MATVPVRSYHQPLHNFSLPFLKWGQRNHTNTNHQFSPPVHSPEPDSDSEYENRSHKPPVLSKNRSKSPFTSCSTTAMLQREKEAVCLERESNENDDEEREESAAKPWNLRPRKASVMSLPVVHTVPNHTVTKSVRLRGERELEREEKKRKLWISLSREEIEEDVYSLTGSKPARRPKKRPKAVQKQLDNLFPGVYLVGITAESYRVHNALK